MEKKVYRSMLQWLLQIIENTKKEEPHNGATWNERIISFFKMEAFE